MSFFKSLAVLLLLVGRAARASAQLIYDPEYTLITLAGTSRSTCLTRTGICGPEGVAMDSTGTTWVAEGGVAKISRSGVVSLFVATSDSDAANPGFSGAYGIAVDRFDNVYVTEWNINSRVRKITPSGAVTTLAGRPWSYGNEDGPGAAATFYRPSGVAVDYWGVVYVTQENGVVRSITPDGAVKTIAGSPGQFGSTDGFGSAARFTTPGGITTDRICDETGPQPCFGVLWVTDNQSHTVRKIQGTQQGSILGPAVVTTVAGSPGRSGYDDGKGAAARFTYPWGIAVAGNTLYVGDGNFTIRRIDLSSNEVTTFAGSPGRAGIADGKGGDARFSQTGLIAVTANRTALVVAVDMDNTVRRVDLVDAAVTTIAGKPGSSIGYQDGPAKEARFNGPGGVAVDKSGALYIADYYAHTVRKLAGGIVTTFAGRPGSPGNENGPVASARLAFPYHVAVGPSGNVYVSESSGIRKITPDGIVSTVGRFGNFSFAVDANETIYAWASSGIVKVSPSGSVVTLVGGDVARFDDTRGLAVSASGDVYFVEYRKGVIRKVAPNGVVSTVAGGAIDCPPYKARDGAANTACFGFPAGIAVDASGRIFVSDSNTGLLRRIADGRVTTIAGSPNIGDGNACNFTYEEGSEKPQDGKGSKSRFGEFSNLNVDASGNLYFSSHNTVRVAFWSPRFPPFPWNRSHKLWRSVRRCSFRSKRSAVLPRHFAGRHRSMRATHGPM